MYIREHRESAERLFRWLRLNQWVALKRVGWLPITLWGRTEADWTREALKGRRCYVGLDLSSVNDLTATAALRLEKKRSIYEGRGLRML